MNCIPSIELTCIRAWSAFGNRRRPALTLANCDMANRRMIRGALGNFLGTYTSRYSDYDGYWLFGMLVDQLDELDIDLLHPGESSGPASPIALAIRLAASKLADQLGKAGIPASCIREARLTIAKLPGVTQGPVNGRVCAGHNVRFCARVVSDLGTTYEKAISVFIAPHNPRIESRSGRAGESAEA